MMSNFERRGGDIVSSSLNLSIEEMVTREREKSRIREEILMAEFLRRQELKEEVIRELILEGKIPLQRTEKFLLGSEIRAPVLNGQDVLGLDSRLGGAGARSSDGGIDNRLSLLNRIDIGMDKKESLLNQMEVGGFGGNPFQRQPEAVTSGVVIKPVINLQKAEPVRLHQPKVTTGAAAKPFFNLCKDGPVPLVKSVSNAAAGTVGTKRKFDTSQTADCDETMLATKANKKVQVDWSCALCQVKATCEANLNAHLKGKKHKAKERASIQAVTEAKEKALAPAINATKAAANNELVEVPTGPASNFWCTICNLGATTEEELKTHKMGNAHLRMFMEKGGCLTTIQPVPNDDLPVKYMSFRN
ncbi:hypothetical protein LguiA_036586 [Lonicera macranthoides]